MPLHCYSEDPRYYPGPCISNKVYHLGGHAALAPPTEHEGIGAERSARSGICEAVKQPGADRNAGSTLARGQGIRDIGAVVVIRRVFACYRGAAVFDAGKVGVQGVPGGVLPSHNAQHDPWGCHGVGES